jgi:hypothetical protein
LGDVNHLLFEDLVAAGVAGLWSAAQGYDPSLGLRFWTKARSRVLGAISDEARHWRRQGPAETQMERWLYAHPEVTPEHILVRQEQLGLTGKKGFICHSLQEAAEWIKQFRAWTPTKVDEPTATGSFEGMYSCFDQLSLSPQLGESFVGGVGHQFGGRPPWYVLAVPLKQVPGHEIVVAIVDGLAGCVFDAGPDVGNARCPKAPEDLSAYTETAKIRFKNGKRHAIRQKAVSYCYGILVTPELQARAVEDLAFAKRRWEWRIKLAPQKAREYPRWSTKFGLGRHEHENEYFAQSYIEERALKWVIEPASVSDRYIWSLNRYPPWRKWNHFWKENSNDGKAERGELAALRRDRAIDARYAMESARRRTSVRSAT